MRQPVPKEVLIQSDGIHVLWDDAHQGYYEHRYLRYQCCCAQCVNEMSGQRMISLADVRKDVEALDWIAVGRYALQFLWSDAHSTGIYPFPLLRQLCQCDQCSKPKAQPQA